MRRELFAGQHDAARGFFVPPWLEGLGKLIRKIRHDGLWRQRPTNSAHDGVKNLG